MFLQEGYEGSIKDFKAGRRASAIYQDLGFFSGLHVLRSRFHPEVHHLMYSSQGTCKTLVWSQYPKSMKLKKTLIHSRTKKLCTLKVLLPKRNSNCGLRLCSVFSLPFLGSWGETTKKNCVIFHRLQWHMSSYRVSNAYTHRCGADP